MQSMKETASNAAASAKAGMEKTKASVGEKVDKMRAHGPMEKEMAREKKDERQAMAEQEKLEAREQNAAARNVAAAGGRPDYTTVGNVQGTGAHLTGGNKLGLDDEPGYGAY